MLHQQRQGLLLAQFSVINRSIDSLAFQEYAQHHKSWRFKGPGQVDLEMVREAK
jgi:hypothetical protein